MNYFRDLCVSSKIGWVHVFRGLQFGEFSERPWLNFCKSVHFKGFLKGEAVLHLIRVDSLKVFGSYTEIPGL